MGGFLVTLLLVENKGPGFIAQGEGKAEGGAEVTQNLLLGWAAGLQLGPGALQTPQRSPASLATSEGLPLDPGV